MKNAACYLRVSRADQCTALQGDETSQLVERRGWKLVQSYSDDGISGATSSDKRPALRRLLDDARRKRFDVLVVWRSDRLFRSLRELVNTLAELDALGIGFVSVTEPFDTTTPTGRLLMQLVGAFAEFEREVLKERTRAGLDAARRRGKRLGRPRATVDIRQAKQLRAAGRSLDAVARHLGVGKATLVRALASSP